MLDSEDNATQTHTHTEAPPGAIYLVVRDGHRLPEDYPLHNFATRRGGQGARVPVIAAQGRRQEVPEDERVQKGLLLCGGRGKRKHSGEWQAADRPAPAGGATAPPDAARALGGASTCRGKATGNSGLSQGVSKAPGPHCIS